MELKAPDVDTEMNTESLVDSKVRGCGVRKGDELTLGRQKAESSASSAGLAFGICLRPWCGGEQMLPCGRRDALWGAQCPHCVQVVSPLMTSHEGFHFIILFS